MLEIGQLKTNDTGGLRQALWRDTKQLHDRLEAMWTTQDKFASKAHYIAFLEAILQAHLKVGVAAAQITGLDGAVATERARIAALHADLGLADAGPEQKPRMDYGYAWGVGYVLNGSTIGAASIMKGKFLGPSWPSRYMSGGQAYAKSGGVSAFFKSLDAVVADRESVCRGAMETFELFDRQV